ncbi:porin [Polynucleobacter sp. UB-Tiil-W10]|uniref:porin n=1 Tax=Polynucleobacter sp. UB-Tiil-W10 TaxID=1855648 RepID=UPI001C0DCEEE|nr:porin [Polynucleobacter sp. UB-Tiil-W10]MBU3540595.1 porin [Polynucleobacter sp. UB-Tiil-W10]
MKKSLLAVAAIGAFASAAQAQSSVTVYGILDVGYVGGNARVAEGGTKSATQNTVQKATQNSFDNNAESTSRLGFKGTEDLGGGTSAFFTVELGLAPSDSQSGFKSATTTENRQSFAGLKKNGIGDFAIGTQYTALHNAVAATDAAGTNNILGDMIYTSATASATNTGAGVKDDNFAANNGFGAGNSYTIRANNTLTVNTATFAGFTGHGIVIMNNNNSTQTSNYASSNGYVGGTNNQNGWGLGLDYAWNKLFVTAQLQQLNAKQAYNSTGVTVAANTPSAVATAYGISIFGAGQASTLGTNVKDNQYYVGATYDFGILKAYAQYINRKVTAQQDTGFYAKRTGEQIGVRSYITPVIEAWAQGGLGKTTAFGASNPAANMTSWQVGSNYYLSKRTNLYAIYGQVGTSNVSIINSQNPSSFNASNYAVGVRHTF